MLQRIPCKNPACLNTILPSTAERTGGFCMPCVQAAARTERDEYVRQHRRDLNEFEGINDPVEVLKIIHRPRRHDPLVNWIPHATPTEQLYSGLSPAEQRRLAKYAELLVGTERNDEAEEIVLCLAAFTDVSPESCLRAFIACAAVGPSLAYCRASADIRDQLIGWVEKYDAKRNHILLALAWIGDATVVSLFGQWRNSPPSWISTLYIPPQDYAREAGWELAADGKRRDLYFHNCTRLVRGNSALPHSFKAIAAREDHCPQCKQRLTNLVDVLPAEFGIILNDKDAIERIQVTSCEICTVCSTVFGALDEHGKGQWHSSNLDPKFLPDSAAAWNWLPQDSLAPAGKRPPLYAADQFLPTTFSQLGGHPTWVQDADYPQCPSCARTMMFLAQLDRDDIEDHAEGIYYVFVCPACRMTATSYQQT
jgi:hypothetical protein